MDNFKCLVFVDFSTRLHKIITFKTKEVANIYYSIASKKNNLKYVGILNDCIEWCEQNNYNYKIIEREKYNLYE